MSAESPRTERRGSEASSHTEAGGTYEENEKLVSIHKDEESHPREEMEIAEEREDAAMLPQETEKPEPAKSSTRSAIIWMVINTLATIGIVIPALSRYFFKVQVLNNVARCSRTRPFFPIRL